MRALCNPLKGVYIGLSLSQDYLDLLIVVPLFGGDTCFLV